MPSGVELKYQATDNHLRNSPIFSSKQNSWLRETWTLIMLFEVCGSISHLKVAWFVIDSSAATPFTTSTAFVGDSFCNDETNTYACIYDGGDCCLMNLITDYCSECICYKQESCAAGFHPLVGDNFCNDEMNSIDCDYDGGDCCLSNLITEYCLECTCYREETCAAGFHPLVSNGLCNNETNNVECDYDGGDCSCFNDAWIGDGYCDDQTNNEICNYDGGDCCGSTINTQYCSECLCLNGAGKIIFSKPNSF